MKKQTYLNLNYEEKIKPNFPNSVDTITKWFCERQDIVEGLVGLSGEGATKEEVQAAFVQVVPIIIQHDPRKLYEFFDDQGIKISICFHPEFEDHFIYYNSVEKHSMSTETRTEAEEAAFIDAFAILEKRLTNGS